MSAASSAGLPVTHFVVGLAPDGGMLNNKDLEYIKQAVKLGINVDCGLHYILSDDEEIAGLAKEYGVKIRDIRKAPGRGDLHFFSGKIKEVGSLKIAVLGTDSAVGKRTTAWVLIEAFEKAGLTAELVGTGQTAWMQGVRYGLILDALVVDFVTGEIEHAVWQAWQDKRPDVIVIEGQGSLLNPAYPGGMEILSAGRPDLVVLQHAPARKEYDGFPGYALHPLDVQIRAIEAVSECPVAVLTVNHEDIPAGEIEGVCRRISIKTGLPTADVLVSGAGDLLPHLTNFKNHVNKKYLNFRESNFFQPGNDLGYLVAMDTLEIGPLEIKPDRFKAPYSVSKNGTVDTFELIYRYEEDVFDPKEPASVNLAYMIASQAALNYGLFCKKMVFNGLYYTEDRDFIGEMIENTAREIYIKKLLEPNPFIVKTFPRPPLLKNRSYVNSELVFSGDPVSVDNDKWNTDVSQCGILLSGGKESLLSYELLNEIGLETHPVFINESGRHWYTALNGYRYFRKNVPNTTRVWTNSDRLFTWMLGHLPFIRQDFFDLRADDYPVRLWTVAVFLFGAVPIMRKRGAGYIVIGDEYDTTRRAEYEGIQHYAGLYDQSRYFDRKLTDYFLLKRWNFELFSVMRPLSELLVLKLLVERYADIQRSQMSCHMAHIEGDRALPCGKCEKCLRIMGMLKALGADPARCGYTENQIQNCLASIPSKSLHQESATTMHTLYLLAKRGLIDQAKKYEPCREVEHLRFDSECSPTGILPEDIRNGILKIQLEHSAGALKKSGNKWVNYDIFSDPNRK